VYWIANIPHPNDPLIIDSGFMVVVKFKTYLITLSLGLCTRLCRTTESKPLHSHVVFPIGMQLSAQPQHPKSNIRPSSNVVVFEIDTLISHVIPILPKELYIQHKHHKQHHSHHRTILIHSCPKSQLLRTPFKLLTLRHQILTYTTHMFQLLTPI